jgi:hypothetical protein
MVEDMNWREDRRRVRARRCCRAVQYAGDVAGISAFDIAQRAASKRPGISATEHMALLGTGTANPSPDRL